MFRRPPVPLRNGRLRSAGGQLLGSFDPLSVGWAHAYWTEGTEFAAQGYSDTDAVSTWPDEVGTDDLAQATGTNQPTYDADGGPNSTPAVLGDETDDWLDGAFTSAISQGLTVVLIAAMGADTNDFTVLVDGDANRILAFQNPAGTANVYFGGGAGSTDTTYDFTGDEQHLWVIYYNTTASSFDVDGTNYGGTLSINTGDIDGLTLFSSRSQASNTFNSGPYSFVGVFDGDVTTDPNWSDFLTWVTSHYGIVLA